MTVASLFSGAGGLDLGLIQAGNKVVWANDIDKDAAATYSLNISKDIVCADIKDICADDIPDTDVIVGGFPCQGFSVANQRRDVSDERNTLYKFFYGIVKRKQPKFFIAENVKGILSLGNGEVIKTIIRDFTEAGYKVMYKKVDMADYGIPQHRERVIIVGQRNGLAPEILFRYPAISHFKEANEPGQHQWISISEALEDVPKDYIPENDPNNIGSSYKFVERNFTAHRKTDPDKPCPTILARGNGKGGVCAIPHYNGTRRLTVRESAAIQTFPYDFIFCGKMGSCYRQIGNAVPVKFGKLLGEELIRIEEELS